VKPALHTAMTKNFRVYTSEEYQELVSYLKGIYIPQDSSREHFLRRKSHFLRLKKDVDCVKLMVGTKEVVAEYDTAKKLSILRTYHDDLGHAGRDATFEKIYRKYIGVRKKDVSNYIKSCIKCSLGREAFSYPGHM
jgi:hypothetical protein